MLSNCTLKIALGIFYLRVAIQRWHVLLIKLLMAGTVLFGFAYFFLVMFQCIPGQFPAAHYCTVSDRASFYILERSSRE